MNLNTCNFIKRIEQVLAELDISAIEEYVIIIILAVVYCCLYLLSCDVYLCLL